MNNARFVFKKDRLEKNYSQLVSDFAKYFSSFQLAYSFKTNSNPFVLEALRNKGSYAEVVSPFEFEMALSSGFEVGKILYNGVCKDKKTIQICVESKNILNADNMEDLKIVSEMDVGENEKSCGIRISFDNGGPFVSRFGFSILTGEFFEAVRFCKENSISIKGLHCHFTSNRKPENFKLYGFMLGFYSCYFPFLEYLDFGGNLPALSECVSYDVFAKSVYEGLLFGFNAFEKYDGTFEDSLTYIAQDDLMENLGDISNDCLESYKKRIDGIKIFLEPGTALVKDAFDLRCNVIHIKKGFIITDASMLDLGESAISDKCKMKVVNHGERKVEDYVENYKVTGYTCIENDVLKKSYSGKIKVGDEIIFMNCGAYSMCFANSFINGPLPVENK